MRYVGEILKSWAAIRPLCPAVRSALLVHVFLTGCPDPSAEPGPTAAIQDADGCSTGELAAPSADCISGDGVGSGDSSSGDIVVADAAGTSYALWCESFVAKQCNAMGKCCSASVPNCITSTKAACLNPGKYAPIAVAAQNQLLAIDPVLAAACDEWIARLAESCSQAAANDAIVACILSWIDPAKIGEPCQAGMAYCANRKGICVTPNVGATLCTAGQDVGQSCGQQSPCAPGLFCFPPTKSGEVGLCTVPNGKCFDNS